MFARINTVKLGDKTYQYLQILESYYHQGQSKQRVVANLGRIDLLGDKLKIEFLFYKDLQAQLTNMC